MPATPHVERHFTGSETVRDIVIGMSDGLTVPFALAAGLSGAVSSTGIVVTAGLAELAAGSIAMGLGGYLAARTDAEHYQAERAREIAEIETVPERETEEIADVFRGYGLDDAQLAPLVSAIRSDRKQWLDFMMKFELGMSPPEPTRARNSALTIALSYIAGGLIPLAPYILLGNLSQALLFSIVVTLIALFLFGFGKGYVTGLAPVRGGIQTVFVGSIAAAAAFALARFLG